MWLKRVHVELLLWHQTLQSSRLQRASWILGLAHHYASSLTLAVLPGNSQTTKHLPVTPLNEQKNEDKYNLFILNYEFLLVRLLPSLSFHPPFCFSSPLSLCHNLFFILGSNYDLLCLMTGMSIRVNNLLLFFKQSFHVLV